MSKLNDPIAVANFNLRANTPEFWTCDADALHRAVDRLKPYEPIRRSMDESIPSDDAFENCDLADHGLNKVILMLQGMCLETLMKAIIVNAGLAVSTGGKLNFPNVAMSHELKNFAEYLSTKNLATFDTQELRFLEELSVFIEMGRYPTGKDVNRKDLGIYTAPSGKIGIPVYPAIPGADKIFERIFSRLRTTLRSFNWVGCASAHHDPSGG